MAESICEPFQQMVQSMEEVSISDVESPFLVDISDDEEYVDELFAFILEFFASSGGADTSMDLLSEHNKEEDSLNSIAQTSLYPENDALARMDEMLAIINDEIMDALADIVVECVFNHLVTYS